MYRITIVTYKQTQRDNKLKGCVDQPASTSKYGEVIIHAGHTAVVALPPELYMKPYIKNMEYRHKHLPLLRY